MNGRANELTYITLRDKPEWEEKAAAWFHSKWGVPEEAYIECMTEYLNGATEYGGYLCADGDRIVGERLSRQKRPDAQRMRGLYGRSVPRQGNCGTASKHGGGRPALERCFAGLSRYGSYGLLRALWMGILLHGAGRRRRAHVEDVHPSVKQRSRCSNWGTF